MLVNKFKEFIEKKNLIAVIDHSGRAGNAFFLTIFDQHPEVLACPLMHYSYSYIYTAFKDQQNICATEAFEFLTKTSYFRLIYNFSDPDNQNMIYRMGGDNIKIDQQQAINLTREYFDSIQFITRKELLILPFYIYALIANRDLEKIKYILVSDAISLRHENVLSGFSGLVIDYMVNDFPRAKLISLVRDPRATFASPRHQYVNWLGNMYGIKPGNTIKQFINLAKKKFSADNSCVYLFWLVYLAQSAKAIHNKKLSYPDNFLTIRNEDLNLDFYETISKLAANLDINLINQWKEANYHPTFIGKPWQGTGAYNSRYQTILDGPLSNESSNTSKTAIGPNKHVTSRWQKKLSKHEILLLERLMKKEILDLNYEVLYDNPDNSNLSVLLKSSVLPFRGEIPSLIWVKKGFQNNFKLGLTRIHFYIVCLPFYLLSRFILFDLTINKKIFNWQN